MFTVPKRAYDKPLYHAMMETQTNHSDTSTAPAPGPLPPHVVLSDFFEEELVARLLEYALLNEAKFEATTIRGGIVDLSCRRSVRLDLRPMKAEIKARLKAVAPSLTEQLRVTPFQLARVELELVAHGDGAFYKRHIDTFTAEDDVGNSQRMVSAVYYFHSEPKMFSGGALRLHAFGAPDANTKFVDIQPLRNTLVAFPSWAIHEVLPIECPSKRFIDSRFAINCWLRRAKPEQKT